MICARCLMTATRTKPGTALDFAALPSSVTIFGGDALCLSHFHEVVNMLVRNTDITYTETTAHE